MPKLTKRTVDAAVPDPSRTDTFLWDSEVRGFGLKITAAGTKVYILQYRNADGRSRRLAIGKHGSPWTPDEARTRAVALLRELAVGIDPLEVKAEARAALTVKGLAELYLVEGPAERPNKKPASWATDRSNLTRHVNPLLGTKLAKSLTPADIAKFQADVAAGKTKADIKTGKRGRAIVAGGKVAAVRATQVLAAMLQFAADRKLLPANPAAGVKLFKIDHREKFLTETEVAQLADALAATEDERAINDSMAAAIRLLMLTGCRKSEILTLKWDWVDIERSCLRLPDSKTGAKVVPLAAAALEILAGLPRTSEWVLPGAKGDGHVTGLQKAWDRLRERAGLAGLRLHDLRHSFASFAVADGATLFMVGKVLGHKQARTTEIYAHVRDDPLKAVADRTAARIAAAMKRGGRPESPDADKVVPLPTTGRKR